MYPIIKGRVGVATDKKTNGHMGYTWELYVTLREVDGNGTRYQSEEVFSTEVDALESLQSALKEAGVKANKVLRGEQP